MRVSLAIYTVYVLRLLETIDAPLVLAAQRRTQALVPGADVVVPMDAGHVPQLSAPVDLTWHLAVFSHRLGCAPGVPSAIDFMPKQWSHT